MWVYIKTSNKLSFLLAEYRRCFLVVKGGALSPSTILTR